MLAANEISIHFGKECVIEHFSCHIHPGDFACITGPSGCGKTSLLRAFIGLTPITCGEIVVDKQAMNEKTCDATRRKTSYLPQELSFPNDTVNDFITQTFRIGNNKNVQLFMDKLYDNLKKLGLDTDLLKKRLSEISGGQRQRIMLATLATQGKEIWLLDEPTAALDETSRNLVIDFLREQQQQGTTIVAVSHDQQFAAHCSTLIQL